MNFIDLIVIILIVILCIRGYLRGLIKELFSILIVVFGLLGAFLLFRTVDSVMRTFIENRDLSLIISFLSVFIAITVILVIIRNTLIHFVDTLNITDIDHVLGVILGLFKGVIICGAVLIFLKNHSVLRLDEAIEKSAIFPFIERLFIAFISIFPERVLAIANKFLGIS